MSLFFGTNTKGFEEAFKVNDITTKDMKQAIERWLNLYFEAAEHSKNEDDCQRLPVLIVKRLEKAIFSEYSAQSKNEFQKGVLRSLDRIKKKAMRRMLIGGETLLKPIPKEDKSGFKFLVIRRDCFIPLARDSEDNLTAIGTMERTQVDGIYYTLFEKRTAGEMLKIEYKLYRSNEKGSYGRQVPLNSLPKYENLLPESYLDIKGLGVVSLRVPLDNTIDDSADAVAIYAPAEKLIHRIYENEYQLSREFELGRFRMVVPDEMLTLTDNDKKSKKKVKDDIFVALDADEEMGISVFNPNLRYESYESREEKYLRNIENAISLKRGTLSKVEAVERTAKEITSSEGDYSLTITDLQEVWTKCVEDVLELCAELGKAYEIKGAGGDAEKACVDYGNGILYDRQDTLNQMLIQVQSGLLTPEVYLGEYYGMPYETEDDKKAIREKYMPNIDSLTGDD